MTHPATPAPAPESSPGAGSLRQAGTVTVEFTAAAVVVMLLFTVIWQVAIFAHTRSVLLTAAQDGARAAAVAGGSAPAGRSRAEALLATGLGSGARLATVAVDRGPARTQVTVTLPVTAVLPWPAGPHLRVVHTQLTEGRLATAAAAAGATAAAGRIADAT